jgi:ankyrin repeat protein
VAALGGMFYKRTPLHDAAAHGHLEVVGLLLLMGADPNVKDSRERTPLDRAQLKQRQDVADLLLSKGGKAGANQEIGVPGEGEGETEQAAAALDTGQPAESHSELKGRLRALIHNELLIAIVMDNRKWVEEIVTKNPLLINTDFVGFNALYLAVNKGKKGIAELLLDKGANIEAHSDKTDGRTPLHEAVRQGQEDIVKMLLDRGANAFALDNSGKTPLDIAREENRVEIGKVLQAYMGIQ